MLNFRVCGIAAGLAFAVSFIFGLISGNSFVVVLFRALLFGGIFFGLFALGFMIISRFLPELLSESGGDDFDISPPGSRVDISVGSSFEGAFPEDASEAVDDIGGRPSAYKKEAVSPLDQNDNNGYNEKAGYSGDSSDFADFGEPEELRPEGNVQRQDSLPEEALPDIGGLSGEETPLEEENIEGEGFSSPEPRQRYSSKKKPPIAENFDAKELAKAIQTALKKDEKG